MAVWYEIGDGRAIVAFSRGLSPGEPDIITKEIVFRVANDGTIQDRFELTLQTGWPATRPRSRALQAALALPVPAILLAVDLAFAIGVDHVGSFPAAVAALMRDAAPALFSIFALSMLLAFLAWRRSRAFGLSGREQIAWVVFVLLFGLPAFLGFLLSRRWPARDLCTNCRARAPRDRAACAECGSRFPDPALKGIEIFA
jgi:hypothetical protein